MIVCSLQTISPEERSYRKPETGFTKGKLVFALRFVPAVVILKEL
jgi:hypothetical protein